MASVETVAEVAELTVGQMRPYGVAVEGLDLPQSFLHGLAARMDDADDLVRFMRFDQPLSFPVEQQVLSIFAVTEGHMDEVPIEQIPEFEAALIEHFQNRYGHMLDTIRTTGSLPEGDDFVNAIKAYAAEFVGAEA